MDPSMALKSSNIWGRHDHIIGLIRLSVWIMITSSYGSLKSLVNGGRTNNNSGHNHSLGSEVFPQFKNYSTTSIRHFVSFSVSP